MLRLPETEFTDGRKRISDFTRPSREIESHLGIALTRTVRRSGLFLFLVPAEVQTKTPESQWRPRRGSVGGRGCSARVGRRPCLGVGI